MPLRDHFRPPVWSHPSWEGFHGGWPMTMVQQLSRVLPDDFTAEPRVHLGSYFEIDVCAYENDKQETVGWRFRWSGDGDLGTARAHVNARRRSPRAIRV